MTVSNPDFPTKVGGFNLENGVARRVLLGAGLGTSIALYVYELISRNPEQGFGLLRQFGPSFMVAVVAMLLLWDLLKLGVNYIGRLADGVQSLSAAVAKIAEKDDRQFEEMRRLSQFGAQQAERGFELLAQQGDQLQRIEVTLAALARRDGSEHGG